MKGGRAALAICLAALVLRVGAFWGLGRAAHPDVWESEEIAVNLLEGRGFVRDFLGTTYRSYLEPLYPALCAGVYRLTGHSFVALGMVQAVLGALLVWVVFVCGRRMAGERAGLVAALGAAIHPGLILYTTKFHPFVLDSLLLLLVLAACLFWNAQRPWRSAGLLGAALGLCVLSRASVLVCLPIIAWWVWTRDGAIRARAAHLAVVVALAAIVVAPWVARNYDVHHRFMLNRSGSALVFWLGNNPHVFSGSAATPSGAALYELLPPSQWARLHTLDELGQQDFFRAQAYQFVREQPLAFAARWATKLGYFWWQSPQAGRWYPGVGFRVYQGYYLIIVALAIAGVVIHRRQRETLLVAGFCLAISLLQSAYYVEGRHRLAIEPLLLLLAAQALVQLLPWGKKVSS